jgi:hypothetical protein
VLLDFFSLALLELDPRPEEEGTDEWLEWCRELELELELELCFLFEDDEGILDVFIGVGVCVCVVSCVGGRRK